MASTFLTIVLRLILSFCSIIESIVSTGTIIVSPHFLPTHSLCYVDSPAHWHYATPPQYVESDFSCSVKLQWQTAFRVHAMHVSGTFATSDRRPVSMRRTMMLVVDYPTSQTVSVGDVLPPRMHDEIDDFTHAWQKRPNSGGISMSYRMLFRWSKWHVTRTLSDWAHNVYTVCTVQRCMYNNTHPCQELSILGCAVDDDSRLIHPQCTPYSRNCALFTHGSIADD